MHFDEMIQSIATQMRLMVYRKKYVHNKRTKLYTWTLIGCQSYNIESHSMRN